MSDSAGASKTASLRVRRLVPRLVQVTLIAVAVCLVTYRTSSFGLLNRVTAVSDRQNEDVSILSSNITQPQSPGATSQPQSSSTESQPQLPSTESQPQSSSTESQPQSSSTESQPQSSNTESRPQSSNTESRPQSSSTESQPQSSSTESQPQLPSTESQPQLPSTESQPPSSSTESQPPSSSAKSKQIPANLRPPRPERVVRAPFYLKLHKTGSSTIAHHLIQFARSHNLKTLDAPGKYLVATPNPTPYRYDAIVAHHVIFNYTVINSYMKRPLDLILTSMRLPLQRQVSWFQQQNKNLGNVSCESRNDTLLAHFDAWYPNRTAPQFKQMQEADSKAALNGDLEKILDQFDFVFIKERLRESFECFCEKTGIRLCSARMPMVKKNVRGRTCVEQQLLTYRAAELMKGSEMDLLLYEAAGRRLGCKPSEWCRCPIGSAR